MSGVYLDIETTSFLPGDGELTVIGLYIEENGEKPRFVQLIEDDISASKLIDLLRGSKTLYTYNGERFDLPYIKAKLGLDLTDYCAHRDLMHACHRKGLYGGLKKVEQILGIRRKLLNVDGRTAVRLWQNYKFFGCAESLSALKEYNKEDVLNLKILRELLNA